MTGSPIFRASQGGRKQQNENLIEMSESIWDKLIFVLLWISFEMWQLFYIWIDNYAKFYYDFLFYSSILGSLWKCLAWFKRSTYSACRWEWPDFRKPKNELHNLTVWWSLGAQLLPETKTIADTYSNVHFPSKF